MKNTKTIKMISVMLIILVALSVVAFAEPTPRYEPHCGSNGSYGQIVKLEAGTVIWDEETRACSHGKKEEFRTVYRKYTKYGCNRCGGATRTEYAPATLSPWTCRN